MHHPRLNPLIIEMVGSAAICGVAYVAEALVGVRRRRVSARP